MSARQLRRRLRRLSNVRGWTSRQKLAVGVWIPVLIVALALFTGPNRRTSSTAAADETTSTTFVMPVLPPLVPAHLSTGKKFSMHKSIVSWITGVRPKRTAGQLALRRYSIAHPRIAPRVAVRRPAQRTALH